MRKALTVTVLAAALVVLAGREARAETEWYGWQTLAVDAGSIALFWLGADAQNPTLACLAIGSYAIAAPIVHGAHREGGRGAASLGLRLGLPLALGVALSEAEQSNCSGEFCGLGGLILGAGLGMLTAIVLDASALSWHRRVSVQPMLAVSGQRTVIGGSVTF